MTIFSRTIEHHQARIAKADETLKELSTLRLVAFIGSITLILILANAGLTAFVLIFIPLCIIGFGQLIKTYNRVFAQKQHATFVKKINEQELLRLENKLSTFPTGQAFLNRDHAYVSDVDIFGSHSLFQLLNRTTTESGQLRLAEWLAEPASKAVIRERQQAVQELVPLWEWRQDFQAAGMPFSHAKSDYANLLTWVEKPAELLPDQAKHRIISILLSLLSTLATGAFLVHLVQITYFNHDFFIGYPIALIILLIVNSRVLKKVKPLAEEIIHTTQHNLNILGGYRSLITQIEAGKFSSPPLQKLQAAFRQNNYSAGQEIRKLEKILGVFQLRGTQKTIGKNSFYTLFNTLWLLDIHWILLTEKWKNRNRSYLRNWAWAVSEFEVFSSLAGFSHANPSFTFPELSDEPYCLRFEKLGHPLIPSERRVSNDFTLMGRGETAMITGSNMAGKSTFLRTVGINLVLALMGAPCCAASAQVSVLLLFTSMRTQDNLEEGVSSFYAELKRIEQLLHLIESGQPIFFLLDEMFKGTNSEDRYKGGVSLIKQLNELNAFGMISTHDLELAKVAANHLDMANFSFNSEIRNGEIAFNYQLTRGLCTDFNASELMKRSGIKILANFDQIIPGN